MTPAEAFARAQAYDAHAGVQRAVAADLAALAGGLPLGDAPRVLEVGCGTGLFSAELVARWPQGQFWITDLAPAMVARARARLGKSNGLHYLATDGAAPDLSGPFDLIAANLAVQWFASLPRALARWRALLAPGGRIAFSTLVAGSFAEWRDVHGDAPCGIPAYPAPEALAALGLRVEIGDHPLHPPGGLALVRHLRGIGADTPRPGYAPLSAGQLRGIIARFDANGGQTRYRVAHCLG